MIYDRNSKTDGIIQDQQNMQVLMGSTGQMGLEVINRTNGIKQSQGHGRDCAGKPNIEDLDRMELYRSKNTFGITQDQEDRQDYLQDKRGQEDYTGPKCVHF
jgi:hypothetical protein